MLRCGVTHRFAQSGSAVRALDDLYISIMTGITIGRRCVRE